MRKETKTAWAAITWLGLVATGASAADPAAPQANDQPAQNPNASAAPATIGASGCNGTNASCNGTCGAGDHRWYCPTSGFRPIVTAPVYRDAVMYYRYWPDRWYGQQGYNLRPQFPMVYMPTDTTQLGFYYARVPQWQPNPSMYPPAPRPADWHRRMIYSNNCNHGTACAGLNCNGLGEFRFDISPSSEPAPGTSPGTNPGPAPQLGTPGTLPNPGAAPAPPTFQAPSPVPAEPPAPPSASAQYQYGVAPWPVAAAPGQWVPTGGWPAGYAR